METFTEATLKNLVEHNIGKARYWQDIARLTKETLEKVQADLKMAEAERNSARADHKACKDYWTRRETTLEKELAAVEGERNTLFGQLEDANRSIDHFLEKLGEAHIQREGMEDRIEKLEWENTKLQGWASQPNAKDKKRIKALERSLNNAQETNRRLLAHNVTLANQGRPQSAFRILGYTVEEAVDLIIKAENQRKSDSKTVTGALFNSWTPPGPNAPTYPSHDR